MLRYKRRLCYIRSGVSVGAEKLLRYTQHYVISDKVLVTQRRIFAGTKNVFRYIRQFVVSDFVISGFDSTYTVKLDVLTCCQISSKHPKTGSFGTSTVRDTQTTILLSVFKRNLLKTYILFRFFERTSTCCMNTRGSHTAFLKPGILSCRLISLVCDESA